MKSTYLQSVLMVERMHRRFLDVVKVALERQKISDINNVQTMILYNIHDDVLTVGELATRGYYLGSNVSYNIKKLVECGYVLQLPDPHDKRSVRVKLSDKGKHLCEKMDVIFAQHVEALDAKDAGLKALQTANETLGVLERFWTLSVIDQQML